MANFYNDEADKVIKGTSGNDSIHNDWDGYNVSINAGAGRDTIHNESGNMKLDYDQESGEKIRACW